VNQRAVRTQPPHLPIPWTAFAFVRQARSSPCVKERWRKFYRVAHKKEGKNLSELCEKTHLPGICLCCRLKILDCLSFSFITALFFLRYRRFCFASGTAV